MEQSGLSARELFQKGTGLSYSDFTLIDTTFTNIERRDISLETDLGKGVVLKTPIIASPMDTVTNAGLCIALALEGGLGVIHYNHKRDDGKADVEAQIREIQTVKRYINGFIHNPVAVSPEMTIAQVLEIGERHGRGKDGKEPIKTFPVTENGRSDGRLVGLLESDSYFRGYRTDAKVSERMFGLDGLIIGQTGVTTLEQAKELLWAHKIKSIPIVDKDRNLTHLVAKGDFENEADYPLATRDADKRLRVLFAVSTWPEGYERAEAGFAEGADGVVVDTSRGFKKYEREMVNWLVKNYGEKLIIGGNIATVEAGLALREWGVDCYRNGHGTGSICTTAGAIGISRASASGIYECGVALRGNPKTIADGGIREVGDIVKALAVGANATMLGNLLAGVDESPGETDTDRETGQRVKVYRGMGSEEANAGGKVRGYGKLPEGVTGKVKHRGSTHTWIPLIRDGLTSAFEELNCKSIAELHERMYNAEIRFERRAPGSMKESGIHDLIQ